MLTMASANRSRSSALTSTASDATQIAACIRRHAIDHAHCPGLAQHQQAGIDRPQQVRNIIERLGIRPDKLRNRLLDPAIN